MGGGVLGLSDCRYQTRVCNCQHWTTKSGHYQSVRLLARYRGGDVAALTLRRKKKWEEMRRNVQMWLQRAVAEEIETSSLTRAKCNVLDPLPPVLASYTCSPKHRKLSVFKFTAPVNGTTPRFFMTSPISVVRPTTTTTTTATAPADRSRNWPRRSALDSSQIPITRPLPPVR